MNFKQRLAIVMFVFLLIAVFLFFNKSTYTGYVAGLACSDYPEQSLCSEDPLCSWDSSTGACMSVSESEGKTQGYIAALQALSSDYAEALSALNIDIPSTISSLNDYGLQIKQVNEDIALNDSEKQAMIANLEMQVDSLVAEMPQVITATKTISALTANPVEDLAPFLLTQDFDEAQTEQLYDLQNSVNVKMDVKVLSILTFSGAEMLKTYVKAAVDTSVQDGSIIILFPEIASSADLGISGEYEVLSETPPIVASTSVSNSMLSIIIEGDISASADQILFAVIPSELGAEPVIQSSCGDGECTELLEDEIICPKDCARKIPWLFITIILVILILGIVLIGLYKHKLTKMEIKLDIKKMFKPFRKKQLFETETDKQNLKNYIRISLKEHIEEQEIKSTLLSKGWTEQQVNFVLNEVKQESSKSL